MSNNFLLKLQINIFITALLVVLAIQFLSYFFSTVKAGESIISSIDNMLILTSSALVLLITPRLAFFYGGFTQPKNVLNTMIMILS